MMDFRDSREEARFRVEARRWLARHAESRPDSTATLDGILEFNMLAEEPWVEACRKWQRIKSEGGYGSITLPSSLGGRSGTRMEEVIFLEEESRFDVATGAFGVTLGMVAPTIAAHGTPEQLEHIRRMVTGDELWCQLFSEPEVGSDLASIRTMARAEGCEWVIDGQKVWTSFAQYADWGYVMCRTDLEAPKHRGLTAFIVPMFAGGVSVRPIRQMTGGANFNQVYFDSVRVPDAFRLGPRGQGWQVMLTTLMNERFAVAAQRPSAFPALVYLARERGTAADPVIRERLAKVFTLYQLHRYTSWRALTAISRGDEPGPEGAVAKLGYGRVVREVAELAAALAGPEAMVDNTWSSFLCGSPGVRLGGGTDEILRNVMAERVLGLPTEPKPTSLDVPVRKAAPQSRG